VRVAAAGVDDQVGVLTAAVADFDSGDPAGVDAEPANLGVVAEFDVGEGGDPGADDVFEQRAGRGEDLELPASGHRPSGRAEPEQVTGVYRDGAGAHQVLPQPREQLLGGDQPAVQQDVLMGSLS
jgi:hypothetical protein